MNHYISLITMLFVVITGIATSILAIPVIVNCYNLTPVMWVAREGGARSRALSSVTMARPRLQSDFIDGLLYGLARRIGSRTRHYPSGNRPRASITGSTSNT